MSYPKDRNIHRPPHLYFPKTIYFVTCRTIKGVEYFNINFKKELIRNSIRLASIKYKIEIYAWVILNNHYHLLFKVNKKEDLYKFIRFINGRSARLLLKGNDAASSRVIVTRPEGVSDRRGEKHLIWDNYFDKIIRDKADFYSHLNYIHNNPVKHGYVRNLDNLKIYKYSSYNHYLGHRGIGWLSDCFSTYPVVYYGDDQ